MTPNPEVARLEAEVQAALAEVIAQRSARLAQDAGQRLGRLFCKVVQAGANDPTAGHREACDWAAAQTTRSLCDLGDAAGLDVELTRELVSVTVTAFWRAAEPILNPVDASPAPPMTAAEALAAGRELTDAEADEVLADIAADDARTWADAAFRSFMATLRGSAATPADRTWMTAAAGAVAVNLVRQTDHLAERIQATREERRTLIAGRAAAFTTRLEELAVTVLGEPRSREA